MQDKTLQEIDALEWHSQGKITKIHSLKELLDVLVAIPTENINLDMQVNPVLRWLENNYSEQLTLIASIKSNSNFTSQQMHEHLIREIRKILATS